MAQISQGDIFRMLNSRELLNHPQNSICERLNQVTNRSITPSRLSEIKAGKRNGYPDLAGKKDEVYTAFFAAKAEEEAFLQNLKD